MGRQRRIEKKNKTSGTERSANIVTLDINKNYYSYNNNNNNNNKKKKKKKKKTGETSKFVDEGGYNRNERGGN